MELDICQLEALKKFIAYYCNFDNFEKAQEKYNIKTYKGYLLLIARKGITILLENDIIPNLLFITNSIIKNRQYINFRISIKKNNGGAE